MNEECAHRAQACQSTMAVSRQAEQAGFVFFFCGIPLLLLKCLFKFGYLENTLSKVNEKSLSCEGKHWQHVTNDTTWTFWKTCMYQDEPDSFPIAIDSSKEMDGDIHEYDL